mmetsp:Transcript_9782/g.13962  ORF Transcript_9782/g.13962 Transcript_9782/m.13962 type:complete len:179 (+) Transcript_9782:136-672(+)|eukprot:CAMPEP_0201698000 /NCGR_PEP_ID=MMETSP0578-20130828/16242_1 /ASSEMBLY_ACC=CAM_ASM_000663 /TAXON_ID=267565 /ORGANISM="Skeletonema grethea, Strain CCMP 1804" /LENGTH=178 /DNA_ID=CAMNT_0048184391 /DNA_START=58 /DNA_END=594 /DNA_ORIENTATION=+
MGFSCSGNSVFTSLSLDYSTDNQLLANLYAATTYDEDTEATITAKVGGSTVVKETIEVCEYISSGTCGAAGDLVLNLSSFLPDGDVATSSMMGMLITNAYIEIKAKPNGSTEKCKKSTLSTAYQSASPMGSAGKTAGFVIGAVALVGLAAYAVKRRRRSTPHKNSSDYSRRLFGGDMA